MGERIVLEEYAFFWEGEVSGAMALLWHTYHHQSLRFRVQSSVSAVRSFLLLFLWAAPPPKPVSFCHCFLIVRALSVPRHMRIMFVEPYLTGVVFLA